MNKAQINLVSRNMNDISLYLLELIVSCPNNCRAHKWHNLDFSKFLSHSYHMCNKFLIFIQVNGGLLVIHS